MNVARSTLDFSPSAGVTIRADAWGDPGSQPIIFAHGGGQTRHSWGNTASALAQKGWYSIAYDHRGHGESSWCPQGKYGLKNFADVRDFYEKELAEKGHPRKEG